MNTKAILPWVATVLAAVATGPIDDSLGGEAPPAERVLLLEDGRVREGVIEREPDGNIRLSRSGGAITFPSSRVQCIADSVEGLYQFQTTHLPPADTHARYELYKWCLVQGLEKQAVTELEKILEVDPNDQEAYRRLRDLKDRQTHDSQSQALSSAVSLPEPEEVIARFRDGYGDELLQTYTTRLEPILVNRCGRCHGHSEHRSDFRIYHRGQGRNVDQRLTARNLESVKSFIDFRNPGASPILAYGVNPHGQSGVAPLAGPNDRKYKDLRDWVYAIVVRNRVDVQALAADRGTMPDLSRVELDRLDDQYLRPELPGAAGANGAYASQPGGAAGFGGGMNRVPRFAPPSRPDAGFGARPGLAPLGDDAPTPPTSRQPVRPPANGAPQAGGSQMSPVGGASAGPQRRAASQPAPTPSADPYDPASFNRKAKSGGMNPFPSNPAAPKPGFGGDVTP